MIPSSCRPRALRLLILGGSSEATALARAIAPRAGVVATLSLAGRTKAPGAQPVPTRTGGFGGIDGLVSYLRSEHIDILVDATHPFADQMSRHAEVAAAKAACRLIRLGRPPWAPRSGDRWREVDDMVQAVAAIGDAPRRVFLTVGRLQLPPFAAAPQHRYLVRTIDAVDEHAGLADATFILARGPFDVPDEERLMRDHRIEVLVTKNSGGAASAAKLTAARRLGIDVVLVRRPMAGQDGLDLMQVLAAIDAHRILDRRGV